MEQIVIVDENDNMIGEEEKEKCHDGNGILHRAFLAMVFTDKGKLILTKRSNTKRLWPGFWDGSVASHVFLGEDYEQASQRRLQQEIDLHTDDVEYLSKFHYKVGYRNIGTEHEICAITKVKSVDVARINLNRDEISDMRVISLQELKVDCDTNGNIYTPWLKLAVEHVSKMNYKDLTE
ncbi:MAG: isopentenyl-diphosphate delta-isomerase [Nitrospiraceae bacterium]|nr:MAG: isopentenyl-diphosphate delta-isomerase [Nitrospiraceae bacterium]